MADKPLARSFRFDETDMALLKRIARHRGRISQRALISQLLREEARRLGWDVPEEPKQGQK